MLPSYHFIPSSCDRHNSWDPPPPCPIIQHRGRPLRWKIAVLPGFSRPRTVSQRPTGLRLIIYWYEIPTSSLFPLTRPYQGFFFCWKLSSSLIYPYGASVQYRVYYPKIFTWKSIVHKAFLINRNISDQNKNSS